MNADERVIPSRRGRLLIQSIAIAVLAAVTGSVLESWQLLRSSPLGKLAASLGVPLIALVVTALGLWLAITIARDSWTHRVVLGPTSLTIRDRVGSYTVPYSGIAIAKAIPLGGVVIAFRDREQWLSQTSGATEIRRQTSDVLRGTYGADVLISQKQLAIDAGEFIAMLQERAPGMKSEGVQQGDGADERRPG